MRIEPKVTMIASGKGGTGKSTVSVLLGSRLAARGKKVLLIELDSGLRSVDIIAGVYGKTVYDIEDVLSGRCEGGKAVVESLKEAYKLEHFPETGANYQIQFLIMKDKVSIMLDTSGAGLHKRGYRKNSNEAPIKETLAAVMAKLSRVRTDGTLIDPFCGSGTILIEGAMLAMHIAPGLRRHFAAEKWKAVPGNIWDNERIAAKALERRDEGFLAFGYDIDPEAVRLTLENAKKAGVAQYISAEVRDIKDFSNDGPFGCVICNPPYGERLLDVKTAEDIYKTMGRVFTPKRGWSYAAISPDERFETCFGKKADRRRKLYNGMIRCQYYMYFKA